MFFNKMAYLKSQGSFNDFQMLKFVSFAIYNRIIIELQLHW